MKKVKLQIRLPAKQHGEIKNMWRKYFRGKFGEDRTGCYTELYHIGREYVASRPEGAQTFASHRINLSEVRHGLFNRPVRIRLDESEKTHLLGTAGKSPPISRENAFDLSIVAAIYIMIGYSHANGSLINNNRKGDEL